MTSKCKALKVAAKFGLILDESVTGKIGTCGTITFDHPTHSFAGDCHSITVSGYAPMSVLWAEAIERMQREGPTLERCMNPECEYHNDS